MPDLVVHTADVPALITEAEALGYDTWIHVDELGDKSLGGLRTPLVWKWPEAIAVIRVEDVNSVTQFTKMQVLGQYDGDTFVPVNAQAQTTYSAIWNPTVQQVTSALTGQEYTIKPPQRIGAFL